MIAFYCGRCKSVLTAPGALLCSTPADTDPKGLMELPLCRNCWRFVQQMLTIPEEE